MPLPQTIETRRLRLRPFLPSDQSAVERHIGRWEVARMLTAVPHPYPSDGFAQFTESIARDEASGGRVYAVEAGNVFVGCLALTPHESGALEIGYWFAPEVWGRGYASEAARAAQDAAFAETGVPRLYTRRMIDNPASGRVLAKLGFSETGATERFCEARRETVTSSTYALSRQAWFEGAFAAQPQLRTDRLLLRAPRGAEAARIAELANILEVSRWLARLPHPYTVSDADRFLAGAARQVAAGTGLHLALDFEGELVGTIGVDELDLSVARIGWWLGRAYWGRGLMSEAVEAVIAHVLDAGATRLRAGVFKGNAASLRIQEKMGFVVTGESRHVCVALGRELPHIDTLLTREAFAAKHSRLMATP